MLAQCSAPSDLGDLFEKRGPDTPQAQGCANADSQTETHKDQLWHCSPEKRHSALAQHHDHRQQHFQNASHVKASWQLVYPSHKGTGLGRPKDSLGVHGYMGMTYWDVTTLNFVIGTHKLAQKHINPKTKRAFMGVGSTEYNDVLQQHLIPEGKILFQQAGRQVEATAGQCSSS